MIWLLAACGGNGGATDGPPPERSTGVGVNVRLLDGAPMTDAVVALFPIPEDSAVVADTINADVDSAGFALFLDETALSYTMTVNAEGFTNGYAAATLVENYIAGFQMWLAPLTYLGIADHTVPSVLDLGETGTVTWPPLSFALNDAPYEGVVALEHVAILAEDSLILPGSVERKRGDGVVEPLVFYAAAHIRFPSVEGAGVEMALPGVWQIPVVPNSPLALASELATYAYNVGSGFWEKVGDAAIVDGVFIGEMTRFGWWAVGSVAPTSACVRGSVLDDDELALFGAEVIAVQQDTLGIRRANVEADATFCLPAEPATGGQIFVFAWPGTAELVYKDAPFFAAPTGPADCGKPETCLNLGELRPISHEDDDGDGYYQGVGDCDDDDPAVNPTLLLGDGSTCFDD